MYLRQKQLIKLIKITKLLNFMSPYEFKDWKLKYEINIYFIPLRMLIGPSLIANTKVNVDPFWILK